MQSIRAIHTAKQVKTVTNAIATSAKTHSTSVSQKNIQQNVATISKRIIPTELEKISHISSHNKGEDKSTLSERVCSIHSSSKKEIDTEGSKGFPGVDYKYSYIHGILEKEEILSCVEEVMKKSDKVGAKALRDMLKQIDSIKEQKMGKIWENSVFRNNFYKASTAIKNILLPQSEDFPRHNVKKAKNIPVLLFSELDIQNMRTSPAYKEFIKEVQEKGNIEIKEDFSLNFIPCMPTRSSGIKKVRDFIFNPTDSLCLTDDVYYHIGSYFLLSLLQEKIDIKDETLANLSLKIKTILGNNSIERIDDYIASLIQKVDTINEVAKRKGHTLEEGDPLIPFCQAMIFPDSSLYLDTDIGVCWLLATIHAWFNMEYPSEIARTKMQELCESLTAITMYPPEKQIEYRNALFSMNAYLQDTGSLNMPLTRRHFINCEEIYKKNCKKELTQQEALSLLFNPDFANEERSLHLAMPQHIMSIVRDIVEDEEKQTKKVILHLFDSNIGFVTTDSMDFVRHMLSEVYCNEPHYGINKPNSEALEWYISKEDSFARDLLQNKVLGNMRMQIPLTMQNDNILLRKNIAKQNRLNENQYNIQIKLLLLNLNENIDEFNRILLANGQEEISNQIDISLEDIDAMEKNESALVEVLIHKIKPVLEKMYQMAGKTFTSNGKVTFAQVKNHPINRVRVEILEDLQKLNKIIRRIEENRVSTLHKGILYNLSQIVDCMFIFDKSLVEENKLQLFGTANLCDQSSRRLRPQEEDILQKTQNPILTFDIVQKIKEDIKRGYIEKLDPLLQKVSMLLKETSIVIEREFPKGVQEYSKEELNKAVQEHQRLVQQYGDYMHETSEKIVHLHLPEGVIEDLNYHIYADPTEQ